MLNFVIWNSNGEAALTSHISLFALMLFTVIAGILAGILWAASFYLSNKAKLKEYKRQLEKTSVQSEEESSRVVVLEEKIKVLEKALESALGNKE